MRVLLFFSSSTNDVDHIRSRSVLEIPSSYEDDFLTILHRMPNRHNVRTRFLRYSALRP